MPGVGLLLGAGRYGKIDRLALRPRGTGAVVQRRLQRRRKRGRLRRDGQPRCARRRGRRLPRGRSTAEGIGGILYQKIDARKHARESFLINIISRTAKDS